MLQEMQESGYLRFQLLQEVGIVILQRYNFPHPITCFPCVNDDGQIEIAISPTNVEVGMHGYQYMTWMESNSLLFAVIGVMSLREWLYIFGAVSVLLAFAAGMCREIKERIKKAYKDNAELAAETAGGDGAAVADDVDASAPVDYASAPADAYAPYGTAVPEDDTVPTSGDTM